MAGNSHDQRRSDDTIVRLVPLDDQKGKIFNLDGHEFTPDLSFSGDGRWLLAASNDILLGGNISRARLWRVDRSTEQPEAFVLPGVDSFLHDSGFSPDGRFLLTINGGGPTARLWRLDGSEPELAGVLDIPRQTYNWNWDIQFDSNSKVLVVANTDNPTPYLWRLDHSAIPARGTPISNGDRGVKSIHFVDNNRKVMIRNAGRTYDGLSGTVGSHVTIVDLVTFPDVGSTIRVLESSDDLPEVVFRTEIGLLYTDGKALKVQSTDITRTVAQARQALGRNLTLEEWDKIGLEELYRPTFPDLNVDGKTLNSLVDVVERLRSKDPKTASELSAKIVEWTVALNEASICNEIAWKFAQKRDGTNALKAITCGLKHLPDSADFRDTRGVAFVLLGRKSEAIDDFKFATRIWDADPAQAEIVSTRRRWVVELEAGRDPFLHGIK
jgi:WD40 repeat protein